MPETPFAPERIVAALNANDIAYVIVGGLAVAAHGVVRATRDLDHGEVQVRNRMPALPRYVELVRLAITVDVGDGAIATICSLVDLRAMKIASGQPRDLVEVAELDERHGAGAQAKQ